MAEEVKPAEPPPSLAQVNGGNDLEKIVTQEKILIHRGVLRDIKKIVPKYTTIKDGAGKSYEIFLGFITQILIDDENLKKEVTVKYRGIILPDSMDNILEIYKVGNRIQITDVDEVREYL